MSGSTMSCKLCGFFRFCVFVLSCYRAIVLSCCRATVLWCNVFGILFLKVPQCHDHLCDPQLLHLQHLQDTAQRVQLLLFRHVQE